MGRSDLRESDLCEVYCTCMCISNDCYPWSNLLIPWWIFRSKIYSTTYPRVGRRWRVRPRNTIKSQTLSESMCEEHEAYVSDLETGFLWNLATGFIWLMYIDLIRIWAHLTVKLGLKRPEDHVMKSHFRPQIEGAGDFQGLSSYFPKFVYSFKNLILWNMLGDLRTTVGS